MTARSTRAFVPMPPALAEDPARMSGHPLPAQSRPGAQARPKLAVCFFGITRSLRYTLPSITANVLAPLQQRGDVRVYAHFFQQTEIDNPRTGEKGALDPSEHRLLKADRLVLEAPGPGSVTASFDKIAPFGDYWRDDFRSLRNLLHQLHSLDAVTEMVLADGIDICVFCRPDLRYHDSFDFALRRALAVSGPLVQLPWWQPWHAMNDRLAIASGPAAIAAYGRRGRLALEYCQTRNLPLHAERLVQYALEQAGIPVRRIPLRAGRIRFDGTEVKEDFRHPLSIRLQKRIGIDVDPILRWLKR